MKRKKILTILQLILVIVIIFSMSRIGTYYYNRYKSQEEFERTERLFQEVNKETNESDRQQPPEPSNKELLRKLKEINSDVVGYIEIKDLDISYPILYRNNNYYLRRNINKEYSISGSIFLEENNSEDFSDSNTVIYGHNMADRGVGWARTFGRLSEYLSKEDLTDIDNVRIYQDLQRKGRHLQ